jgi:hypothetical protein
MVRPSCRLPRVPLNPRCRRVAVVRWLLRDPQANLIPVRGFTESSASVIRRLLTRVLPRGVTAVSEAELEDAPDAEASSTHQKLPVTAHSITVAPSTPLSIQSRRPC